MPPLNLQALFEQRALFLTLSLSLTPTLTLTLTLTLTPSQTLTLILSLSPSQTLTLTLTLTEPLETDIEWERVRGRVAIPHCKLCVAIHE